MKIIASLDDRGHLWAAGPAQAQRFDLANFRCIGSIAISLATNPDQVRLIVMWFEGYYTEENASPIVDFVKLKEDADKFADHCRKNPEQNLSDAAEVVMIKP